MTATTITAVTAAHAAGTVAVSVTTGYGTGTSATDFSFVAPPTVTAFTPTTGSTNGGTTVTITGTGFAGASLGQVRLDNSGQLLGDSHNHHRGDRRPRGGHSGRLGDHRLRHRHQRQ